MKKDEIDEIELSAMHMIRIDQIRFDPTFIHRQRDPETQMAMTQSVKANGVLHPVTVRKHQGTFYLLNGEGRFGGAKKAGHKTIPARYPLHDLTESQRIRLMHGANRHQTPLTADEVAKIAVAEYGPEAFLVELGGKPRKTSPGGEVVIPMRHRVKRDFEVSSWRTVDRVIAAARKIAEGEKRRPRVELTRDEIRTAKSLFEKWDALKDRRGEWAEKLKTLDESLSQIEKDLTDLLPSTVKGSRADKLALLRKQI